MLLGRVPGICLGADPDANVPPAVCRLIHRRGCGTDSNLLHLLHLLHLHNLPCTQCTRPPRLRRPPCPDR